MGQPDCDKCLGEIESDELMVQVVCYHPEAPENSDEEVEHLAYFHRHCWDALIAAHKT